MAASKDKNPIHLRDKVEVISTKNDPHHATGEKFKVHPVVAESLIKKGLAEAVGAKTKDK